MRRVRSGRALTLCRELGDAPGTMETLDATAFLVARAGLAGGAALLFGTVDALQETRGTRPDTAARQARRREVAEIDERLNPDDADAARAEGRRLTAGEAIARALDLLTEI